MAETSFISLFSGGKDSYLAYVMAAEAGHPVDRLVTVDAAPGSYLYHTPTTELTDSIAAAMGIPLERIEMSEPHDINTSTAAADREIEPLRAWIEARVNDDDDSLGGLVSGVVASRYQYELLDQICEEYGLDLVTPLWGRSGEAVLDAVIERGLTVEIVAVAAEGFDESWLGRRIDDDAVQELLTLMRRHGIHPAGEGGEFETLVVDAPTFDSPIQYTAEAIWSGDRGHLQLLDAPDVSLDTQA